ncbi:hypothetical protein ACMD2_04376 [Ananas comosus]|uniref:Transmembrane protein n=2 Tax=Ananas comosus TaxID=4615 RepID=A0A199UIB1_ANACO|nr:hypothetical protein ACMD2_04376 [Ananas comosus]CAD1840223.1 unnamed protein product [Ananas comosus var. bracteatus]
MSKEEWRRNADTHKMSSEEVKAAGVEASKRPPHPGQKPGEVLHQRRALPYSPATMAIAGFAIVGTIGYFTLYYKSKPGTSPTDVVKVTTTPDSLPSSAGADKAETERKGK